MLYMNFLPSLFSGNLRLQHLKVSYQYPWNLPGRSSWFCWCLKKKKKPFVLISGCRPAVLKWICFGNNPNPTLLIGWLILCLLLLLYILKLQEEAAVVNDSSVYQVTLSEPSSSVSNGQQYAVITGLPSTGWCIWLGLGLNIHTFNRLQSSRIM